MIKAHHIVSYSIAIITGGFICSCGENSRPEISDKKVYLENLESDGTSGATALGDAKDLNWNSPIARLKKYLDSNSFIIDTIRLKQLAAYAYQDLRKTPFSDGRNGIVNQLDKSLHSMNKSGALINGEGYYFTKIDSLGDYPGIDLGFEHWKIDSSNPKDMAQLELWWKEKYHPMPLYISVQGDDLYVLYTRSVQYASFVETCLKQIEK